MEVEEVKTCERRCSQDPSRAAFSFLCSPVCLILHLLILILLNFKPFRLRLLPTNGSGQYRTLMSALIRIVLPATTASPIEAIVSLLPSHRNRCTTRLAKLCSVP